ncbi:MAG: hypothetical protein KDK70_40365 [Myxococcales bacterium]|nr:hypothetical protein [Myxococcales bacterium]
MTASGSAAALRGRHSPDRDQAPRSPGVVRRDIEPEDMARVLRAVLGLPPDDMAPGEAAATVGRSLPSLVRGVDAGGWVAWCLVGLGVFAEPHPTMRRVRIEPKRLAVALAMLRADGCISAAARALDISRKVLRDHLRDVGLYPWPSVDQARSR